VDVVEAEGCDCSVVNTWLFVEEFEQPPVSGHGPA
jgi:hypothetical protein